MDLKALRIDLNKKIALRKNAWITIQTETAKLTSAEEYLERTIMAQEHIQLLAQEVQTQAHRDIARIVSRCLNAVFDDPYELFIDFVRTRGRTEAKLIYRKGGNEINPLLTSGGVLDVSALALRVSSMMLCSPQPRKLLILDEPFVGVSARNLPRVGALIETLACDMGIQFVIVTHSEVLQIGRVIRL